MKIMNRSRFNAIVNCVTRGGTRIERDMRRERQETKRNSLLVCAIQSHCSRPITRRLAGSKDPNITAPVASFFVSKQKKEISLNLEPLLLEISKREKTVFFNIVFCQKCDKIVHQNSGVCRM